MATAIQKWGNSHAVRIPKSVLELAQFRENEEVEVCAEAGQIIVRRPAKKVGYTPIEELFAGHKGEYEPEVVEWGEPAGGEVW